jgi:3-dehydroquinate dehydratase
MKKTTIQELNKDFATLCKKHNLKTALFVSEWDKSLVLDVHSTNKKNEKALMDDAS